MQIDFGHYAELNWVGPYERKEALNQRDAVRQKGDFHSV